MKEITSFTDESLLWLNNPKLWISTDTPQDNTGNTEGSGGDYDITEKSLLLKPPAFKDFWVRDLS